MRAKRDGLQKMNDFSSQQTVNSQRICKLISLLEAQECKRGKEDLCKVSLGHDLDSTNEDAFLHETHLQTVHLQREHYQRK